MSTRAPSLAGAVGGGAGGGAGGKLVLLCEGGASCGTAFDGGMAPATVLDWLAPPPWGASHMPAAALPPMPPAAVAVALVEARLGARLDSMLDERRLEARLVASDAWAR
jgi:hypothetical protein